MKEFQDMSIEQLKAALILKLSLHKDNLLKIDLQNATDEDLKTTIETAVWALQVASFNDKRLKNNIKIIKTTPLSQLHKVLPHAISFIEMAIDRVIKAEIIQ